MAYGPVTDQLRGSSKKREEVWCVLPKFNSVWLKSSQCGCFLMSAYPTPTAHIPLNMNLGSNCIQRRACTLSLPVRNDMRIDVCGELKSGLGSPFLSQQPHSGCTNDNCSCYRATYNSDGGYPGWRGYIDYRVERWISSRDDKRGGSYDVYDVNSEY